MTVVAPNGLALAGAGVPGGGGPVLRVRRPKEFLNRLGTDGLIGFGEAYQTGAWDTETGDELVALLTELAARLEDLVPRAAAADAQPGGPARAARPGRRPARRPAQRARALRPVQRHVRGLPRPVDDLLLGAVRPGRRRRRPRRPARRAAPQDRRDARRGRRPQGHAGCWRSARAGARWRSRPPASAAPRCSPSPCPRSSGSWPAGGSPRPGLADRVEVRLADYREVAEEQPFDAVVSVEMIEAVGRRYLPDYFQAIERNLAPGGRVASRPSPWPTTACWRPRTRTPGSTSTSSPAA